MFTACQFSRRKLARLRRFDTHVSLSVNSLQGVYLKSGDTVNLKKYKAMKPADLRSSRQQVVSLSNILFANVLNHNLLTSSVYIG